MKIIFDATKDRENLVNHGVSISLAEYLDWESLVAEPDARHDYGEVRMVGYALLDTRLFCVIFTDRGDYRRIISLRKANNREKKRYVSHD